LTIAFDYDGEVTAEDADQILAKITALHARAVTAAAVATTASRPERAEALRLFAASLEKAFYSFEPDFFLQNVLRIVDDVITLIKSSIELWPTLVEIGYFQKHRGGLPRVRVQNQRL
jgi:hypothetical protein